jgi:hypothetical protein
MALNNIHAFGEVFNIDVSREKDSKLLIRIMKGSDVRSYKIGDGETANILLSRLY